MTLLLMLLAAPAALALNTGDLALIGYFYQGVCPPDPSPAADVTAGCFSAGIPSVDCRQENMLCPSTQIQAISLLTDTNPGPCSVFTWRWYCTAERLVHCVAHVWCDALALCNATAATCTCQGNLSSLADGACGCGADHYLGALAAPYADAEGKWTNYSCFPLSTCTAGDPVEVAPPTSTSDRQCAPATTAPTTTPSVDNDHGNPVWYGIAVALLVIAALVIFVFGTLAYRNYRDSDTVCPA
jgi:hypothetical protein